MCIIDALRIRSVGSVVDYNHSSWLVGVKCDFSELRCIHFTNLKCPARFYFSLVLLSRWSSLS